MRACLSNTETSVLCRLQGTENINAMQIMNDAKGNSRKKLRERGKFVRRTKDPAMIKVCTNAAGVVDVALIRLMDGPALHVHSAGEVRAVVTLQKIVTPSLAVPAIVTDNVLMATAAVPEMRAFLLLLVPTAASVVNANQDVENPALRPYSTGKVEGKVEVELEVRVVIAFQEDRVTPILDIAVVMEYVLTATAAVPEIRASLWLLVSTAASAADAALI